MPQIFSHLQRHTSSGIFYFRLTVPERLRFAMGKREIKQSLRTGLRSEAVLAAMRCYLKAQELFQQLEDTMTERRKTTIEEELAAISSPGNGHIGLITGTMKKPDGTEVTFNIEREDAAEEAQIAAQLLGAGNSTLPQQQPQDTAQELENIKLSKVIKKCVQEHRRLDAWTEKTAEENQGIFQIVVDILRNPPIETIGRKEVQTVKQVFLGLPPNYKKIYPGKTVGQAVTAHKGKAPIALTTMKKYARRTSYLFSWAVDNNYCFNNPFAEMSFPGKSTPAHKQRKRFNRTDIDKLLDPEHFNLHSLRKTYSYWLLLLGLYTGARINELCQLHLEDIYEVDGIFIIDINEDTPDKRLKLGDGNARLIPIHPKLIEHGFLDYAKKLRKQKTKRLFPELKKGRDGYGQTASKWFTRYRKTCGVVEKGKTFHSFRHTLIDELKQRNAEMSKLKAIVGHTDTSITGGRYGKPYRPDVLYPIVCMFNLEGMK